MQARCFIIAQILSFFLFFSGMSAFAQHELGQWVGDLYSIIKLSHSSNDAFSIDWALIGEDDKIRKTIPSLAKSTDPGLPLPRFLTESFYAYWLNDALYSYAYGARIKSAGGGFPITPYTFAKWQDGKWHYLGHYKVSAMERLIHAIPCDNDKFIIITQMADRKLSRQERTPFTRLSLPKSLPQSLSQDEAAERTEGVEEAFFSPASELKLESSIDHGMDDLRPYMGRTDIFKLAWYSNVIMTDRHATLINYSTGLYWVFSLEKASLVKAGNIFKEVTTEMILNGGFPNAVLCANPEKDGTILIAAQEELLFTKETSNPKKDLEKFKEQHPLATKEDMEKMRKHFESEWRQRNQVITWYRVYPENGRVEILKVPPAGGDILRNDTARMAVTTFRTYADGSVNMSFMDRLLKHYMEKQPVKGQEEKEDGKALVNKEADKAPDSKVIGQDEGTAQKIKI
jgi:hypothetical protein